MLKNYINFLDCISFGFEIINQKIFGMEFFKMAHFTFLVILSYTCGHCPKKLFTWFTNLVQSYRITIFNKNKKFRKDLKSF